MHNLNTRHQYTLSIRAIDTHRSSLSSTTQFEPFGIGFMPCHIDVRQEESVGQRRIEVDESPFGQFIWQQQDPSQ